LLTLFDSDGRIRYDALEANATQLNSQGIRTCLAPANISEYHTLSQSERVKIAETSVDTLPSSACVLAGVGGATSDARDLVQAYERADVDAMMVMPPDHTYVHEQGCSTITVNSGQRPTGRSFRTSGSSTRRSISSPISLASRLSPASSMRWRTR